MKLRNKKTGYIATAERVWVDDTNENIVIDVDGELHRYYTLGALKQEWEDYEEPKDYCWIDIDGEVAQCTSIEDDTVKGMKEIGNYFETEEEAEKALEKLKAWKRLRDKGFKFKGTTTSWYDDPCIEYETNDYHNITDPEYKELQADLDLLFGGGE